MNTPSPPSTPSTSSYVPQVKQVTPQSVRRIEERRLMAKERIADHSRSLQDALNDNGKRPLSDSVSPAAKSAAAKAIAGLSNTKTLMDPKGKDKRGELTPLKPNKKLSKYFEYDLSKMVDSRGGFLVEDNDRRNNVSNDRSSLLESRKLVHDPPLSLDMSQNPRCKMCGSVEIDPNFDAIFHVRVCYKCKEKHSEKFSLLTKTECREDYLLTDAELRDTELMPHWLKPNPHKATWNNMMLYLREQVEEFAFKKWGGEQGLDKEYERRMDEKKMKRKKKFQDKLKDLRKNTRTSGWQKRKEAEHKHVFGPAVVNSRGATVQVCAHCDMEIEIEEF